MFKSTLKLIVRKTRQDLLKGKASRIILATVFLFCTASIILAFAKYRDHISQIQDHRKEVRENWEHRPDKHPHRMAHYGYLVFRSAHPLSIFDGGLDDFLGNVIFLEAHKQNTANISEAGSSGILVRFGSFNSAFILQTLVPLIIIFFGYALVSQERENATLKILNLQGASARDILWGKVLGLWQFSLYFLIPLIPVAYIFAVLAEPYMWLDILIRVIMVLVSYTMYYFFIATITVIISSFSKTSSLSLVSSIGCWLLLVVFLPKTVQFIAQNIFPTPSRIAFETTLEEEIIKSGDSHNPDDPHFKKIKDSLLKTYHVDETAKLPFNYSGFIMKEGEKMSSQIYTRHQKELQGQYINQLRFSELFGFVDPLLAVKNYSMTAAGTDFDTYQRFQGQAEQYRYKMAQHLNDLQIENISNIKPTSGQPAAVVTGDHWKEFADFEYRFSKVGETIKEQIIPFGILIFWLIACACTIEIRSRNLKFI